MTDKILEVKQDSGENSKMSRPLIWVNAGATEVKILKRTASLESPAEEELHLCTFYLQHEVSQLWRGKKKKKNLQCTQNRI